MNKLIVFPLSILIMIVIINFIGGDTLSGDGFAVNTTGDSTINGTTTTYEAQGGGIFSFDLFSGDGLLITLIALGAVGIVAGIQLFGSGLSETSQRMIVLSVGFLGLWGALTIMAKDVILEGTGWFGIVLYLILTIIYGIGFLFQFTGSDA